MAKKKKKKLKQLSKELPEKFLTRMVTLMGPARFRAVRKTFVDKPTTFRVNRIKATKEEVKAVLDAEGFKVEQVLWYRDAWVLKNKTKRALTDLPMYMEGKIYIQSLASMIPPLALDPKPGETVLDLTAAPGSKTSQMAAMMEKKGFLVANDLNKIRFFRLKHNMELLGVSDPQDAWDFRLWMKDGSALCNDHVACFDNILLDAPCSGEARFVEGYPKSYGFWNEKKIKRLAFRQQKLLIAAWQALKPGGTLVYSTCTMAPEENESRVSKMLERFGEEMEIVPIEGLDSLKRMPAVLEWQGRVFDERVKDTLRVLPTDMVEGFYIAKMRKTLLR